MRLAERQSRSTSWGIPDPTTPLTVLIDALHHDARYSPLGKRIVRGALLRTAGEHLNVQKLVHQFPAVANEAVRQPLFIVGLPRTGTTLLYNLICCDPQRRPLFIWESMQPYDPALLGQADRRQRRAWWAAKSCHWLLPELDPIHRLDPSGPEECFLLLHRTFVSGTFHAMYFVPSYLKWLLHDAQDYVGPAYEFYKRQLQLLQLSGDRRPWALKNPAHICGLAGLLETFPDACVVQTHRDLSKVAASWLSLVSVMRNLTLEDPSAVDHSAELDCYADVMRSAIKARETYPSRFCDVQFQDLVREPIAAIERIYATFGLKLTPEHVQAAEAWLRDHPQNKHGKHAYSLEQFGLSTAEVQRRFGFFAEYYGTKSESRP